MTFDPAFQPEACSTCRQKVVKVHGACPLCATVAARRARGRRPVVAPGPWPRLVLAAGPAFVTRRGPSEEVRVASVVELGGALGVALDAGSVGLGDEVQACVARVEPEGRDGVRVTALADGVSCDGTPLAPGTAATLGPDGKLGLPGGREALVL